MTTGTGRRSVVIHGHFYQPPREDPWIDLVEREISAAPFHDWNQRVDHECYRAVLAARVVGEDGSIRRIVNTLEWISFNVGPTLLEWMEKEAPATYRGILAADRASMIRLGAGNAIAMPYHHTILPLASYHDKVTEVRWGIADFRRRFGREPVGMWLPETAVDDETLDVLAMEGIHFTLLAPHQLTKLPPAGLPGRYQTGRGRSIVIIPYDGGMSHDVAFGPLVRSADLWLRRLLEPPLPARGPRLESVATDGETYGHHHKFGDMALAAVLHALHGRRDVRIENFASFLARHPPQHNVTIEAPTSWSCAHGVERWRSDCGCRMTAGTSQAWRAPLRDAIVWLTDELHALYGAEAAQYFEDPWAARTTYGITGAPSDLPERARELIELERNALRSFTSCGWFFDDIGGIESIQILRYAARALDLAGPTGPDLERGFLERLAAAESNDPALGTGADIYRRSARPRWPAEQRVAAGFAAMSGLCPGHTRHLIGGFLAGPSEQNTVQVQHRRTGHRTRFAAQVHRTAGFRLEIDLTDAEGRQTTLGLEALPEREHDLAREVLRREVLREVMSPEDLVRLAHGSVAYPEALRSAITRLVPESTDQVTADTIARLVRSLDLLALEELTVPFEAQTRFFRLMEAAGPHPPTLLAGLSTRLGFSRDAFDREDR